MDEKKLSELFNDAVRDAPPATFGTGEVRKASRRATIKRRNTVVAASALAFALVAGGTVTTVALSGTTKDTSAANAPALAGGGPPSGGTMERGDGPGGATALNEVPTPNRDNRSDASKQGGTPTGNASGDAGSTPRGCQADQELAAALAGELLAAPSKTLVPVPFGCPDGARSAAYKVTEGTRVGTISVVLLAPGMASIAPLGSEAYGYTSAQSETPKGNMLHIVSQPDPAVQPAEAPYTDALPRMAAGIAPRF